MRTEDPPEHDSPVPDAEITNQNAEDEDAEGSDIMDEGAVNVTGESAESNESAEETDADLDEDIEASQDEIRSFSTNKPVEVCESIEEFPSPEPPPKQRTQESIIHSHDQKRSKTDDNPP